MQKFNHFFLSIFLFATLSIGAQTPATKQINLSGKYNDKNIFVRNSYGAGGIGFCVKEISVNGKTTKDEINADVFMIDLASLSIKNGDEVTVIIKFDTTCTPRTKPLILNPGALLTSKNESNEEQITIEGGYSYQNIFLVNSKTKNDKDFGIKNITINGKPFVSNINQATIEIDLFGLKLNYNDKIKIDIRYTKGCDPTILNPEALSTN